MARIDAAENENTPRAGRAPVIQRSRSWIEPLLQASPGIRRAVIAQAATILLLVGIIAWPGAQAPIGSHRTLSDVGAPVVGPGLNIRVVFAPETPESRIRAILRSIQGEIISGPTPLGVYTVTAPVSEPPDLTARTLLEKLRSRPELTFAELAAR